MSLLRDKHILSPVFIGKFVADRSVAETQLGADELGSQLRAAMSDAGVDSVSEAKSKKAEAESRLVELKKIGRDGGIRASHAQEIIERANKVIELSKRKKKATKLAAASETDEIVAGFDTTGTLSFPEQVLSFANDDLAGGSTDVHGLDGPNDGYLAVVGTAL